MKMKVAAQSVLNFNHLGMGRATENTTAIASTDIQPSEVLFLGGDANKDTIGNLRSRP